MISAAIDTAVSSGVLAPRSSPIGDAIENLRRVERGLYRCADGRVVNADVNGSCNIGRKVIQNSEFIGRLDKSLAARPVRINPLKTYCV